MAILKDRQPFFQAPDQGRGDDLDRIYNDPDTAHALDLFERFGKRTLDDAGFKSFLDSLPATPERAKIEKLLAEPNAPGNNGAEADLSTRAGQLAWAAALGHVFQTSQPGTIRSHAIWRTLTHNPQLAGSLGAAARYVDLSSTNRNATMDWGTPGSWFWFSPDKNHINIDLFHTLLTGFGKDVAPGVKGLAHAAGVMMHEVGHSQLTTRFTDRMIELQKREKELLDASKQRKLTRDEFKDLARTRTEFSLRMNVLNAAEDNCVNRYAANQSREFPHDFGESLNLANIILQGSGLYLKSKEDKTEGQTALQDIIKKLTTGAKQKEIEKAGEALGNLNKVLALAFYTTNGLFDTADTATWKRLGIDPDEIRAEDTGGGTTAADKFFGKESDFDRLMRLVIGADGIANLQPSGRDRWLLQSVFARSVQSYADRRCAIMEEIWDKYAARYAKVLIDAADENAENAMNQKANGKQNGKQQDGQGQGSGQSQGGGGGNSQQENSDDPSPSQGSGGGSSSGGSQSQPGGQQEGGGSGSPSSVDVEGVGKMDIDGGGEPLPATPEDVRKQQRKASEDETKPENAKTVRDLARDAKQKERAADPANNNDKGSGSPSQGNGKPGDLSMNPSTVGGREKGLDLAALSKGSWSEFRKRINELEPVINRVAQDLTYIRNHQKQIVRSISREEREKLPRGGDIRERLDMRSHMNFAVKRATGQKIEEPDLQRWRKDRIATESTSVELWILGDGSSSMKTALPGGGRRIDSAVQSMAVLYEAGRRADFDTFVGMWGDDHIRLLAAPGDTDQKIGDNFECVRNGIDSGTQLSPSFSQAIARSAKQETNAEGRTKRFAGMTHFLIISDGELNGGDIEPMQKMLLKLFRYGPAVSVDIAVLGGSGAAQMDQVVAGVKQANPGAALSIIKASSAKEIPVLLTQKIKRRFEQSAKDFQAMPDAEKREAFSRAERAIQQLNIG